MLNGSLPSFALAPAQFLVIGARGLAVLGLLGAFGTLLLRATAARPLMARAREAERATRRLAWASLLVLALGLGSWACIASALLSETATLGGVLSAIGAVIPGTMFGRLILGQAAAAMLAAIALGRGWAWPAAAASGVAVALHAVATHPGASVLLVAQVLHLLAAGAWLGGLPGILLLLRRTSADETVLLARRFWRLATVAVVAIAGTAAWQGSELSGGLPGLAGTAYGWVELAKLALFLLMLGCAAGAQRALGRRLAAETVLGVLVICAAAVLTGLEPGAHVQPVWPFREQPSLLVVQADDLLRREVADAIVALLGALSLVALGIIVRWIRWVAWAVALAIAWLALPHLGPLLVRAYPTSFYRSPTGFAASSIAEGAALYPAHCAACHGRGDGPARTGLRIAAADLGADHIRSQTDGAMFWWLSHGIVSAAGEMVMPGFAGVLSEDERWALIDYVRAYGAGLTHRTTGEWSPPVQAPAFEAICADGRRVTLGDLRGRVVRLAFGDGPATIAVEGGTPGGCVAENPAIAEAYAIVTGSDVAGTEVLVDAQGWLRAVIPIGRADRPGGG